MTLQDITAQFEAQSGNFPSIGKSIKFLFNEGAVFIDLNGTSPQISNADSDADCTIVTSIETMEQLRSGSLNPMMAIMSGKIKVKGDMSVAMKLQSMLGA